MRNIVVALALLCLSLTPSSYGLVSFNATPLNVSTAGTPVQVAVGDVDGDGANELVVISDSSPSPQGPLTVYSISASGDATLEYAVPLTAAPVGIWSYVQPRILDVDGDGDRDIALYLRSDGQPGLLQLVKWDQGSSSFTVDGPYTMPETDAAYSFDIADLTGDGVPDVVTANHGLHAPQGIFVTSGASGYTSFTSHPFPFAGISDAFGPTQRGIVHVYARDLDHDGRVDVAVSTAPSNATAGRIYWNRPGPFLGTTHNLSGAPSIDLGFGDQSGDGKVDIVANGNHTSNLRRFAGPNFTFTPSTFSVPAHPRTPVVMDFNGDGRVDMATAVTSLNNVNIIVAGNQGSTPVTSAELSAANFMPGTYVQELSGGDVDNDGRADLVFATDRVILIRQTRDFDPPVITLTTNRTAEATSSNGALVNWTVSANDAGDGTLPASRITCNRPHNPVDRQFAVGVTTVTCSATDYWNNVATGSFTVTVVDTTKPVLTLPAPITVDATSASGAVVTFTASATDLVSGSVPVLCIPSSGSTFAPGTASVACTATDGAGNVATGSFAVTVVAASDVVAPVLTLPSSFVVEATSPAGAVVTFTAAASDLVSGVVPVPCTPPSGSTFALGTTTVTCSATDGSGNTATGSFAVTVRDSTGPAITGISATPSVLGPANHKMVPVVVTVGTSDAGDSAPVARIVRVTSNEPVNGTGDGDTAPDWVVTGPLTLNLRAERAGIGTGRVYTITVEVTDRFGNKTSANVLVKVSK
jgi:hypothetical protein